MDEYELLTYQLLCGSVGSLPCKNWEQSCDALSICQFSFALNKINILLCLLMILKAVLTPSVSAVSREVIW